MSDEPKTVSAEIVPYQAQPSGPLEQLQSALAAGAFLTSLPVEDFEGRFKVAELLTSKGEKVEDWINKEFAVVNYLLTVARWTDEKSGEEIQTIVTRLLMPDDVWIETHSYGVLKALGAFVQLFGKAPWQPGLPVRLVRRQLRSARSWVTLELVRPAVGDKPAGKTKGGGK